MVLTSCGEPYFSLLRCIGEEHIHMGFFLEAFNDGNLVYSRQVHDILHGAVDPVADLHSKEIGLHVHIRGIILYGIEQKCPGYLFTSGENRVI